MADLSPDQVLEAVENWNLMQVKEFVDKFCEKFDVSASAPAMAMGPMMAAPGAEAAEVAEEQTEFAVHMTEFGAEKIKVIKEVRAITSLGLKEAKDLVEGVPCDVVKDVPKDEADKFCKQLIDVGATVEVK